jgi:hypothetical protein
MSSAVEMLRIHERRHRTDMVIEYLTWLGTAPARRVDSVLFEKPIRATGPIAALTMAALLVVLHLFAFSNYRQRGRRLSRIGLQGAALSGALAISWAVL